MTFAALLDRRALLRLLSALPVAGLPAWAASAAAEAGLITASVCRVAPETTAGPFYLDPRLVRRDITEGRPGVPLRLMLQVVTVDCRPVEGARVDVWHCDALGEYSGFGGADGETFLRGTQVTGGDGVARFDTIWPGWYRGRTTHIHYKVLLADRTALTSQVFFPDEASDAVHGSAEPYARRGPQDTPNAADRIARRAGAGAFAEVSRGAEGLAARLVAGIDPGA
jgi:protocatechuate 3,4-dioxygenase beta subunit